MNVGKRARKITHDISPEAFAWRFRDLEVSLFPNSSLKTFFDVVVH